MGFPGGTVINNPPVNTRDTRDMGLIPISGRYPRLENGTHFSILTWRIPWAKEPGGLQPMGSQKVEHD